MSIRLRASGGEVGFAAFTLLLGGCASLPELPTPSYRSITPFSAAQSNGDLPGGWKPWRLSRLKKPTSYHLIESDGTVVVKALAAASASGLMHPLMIDPRQTPFLRWRWKVPQLIVGANNAQRSAEDAPVRIILSFDGDIASLPLEDRLFYDRVKAMTGHGMPYATLMYIWENRAPRGTIIANPHTRRVQMVVAESGPALLGTWKLETRNVYEDYKRAFGAEPAMVKSIAIMTDTDNTGTNIEAYYGDIAFLKPTELEQAALTPPAAAAEPR